MRRTIWRVIGLLFVSTACGRPPSPAHVASASSGVPTPTISASGTTDPLEGDWRQEFTCEGLVRTLRLQAKPIWFSRSIAEIVRGAEGAKEPPPPTDLCVGAPATFERIIRFRDARVVFFDPPRLQADGLNATYELRGDHTFVVTDTQGNISGLRGDGILTCTFQLEGDRLTIHERSHDPWDISGFQAGPLVRIG
jgi:hypothetical protein